MRVISTFILLVAGAFARAAEPSAQAILAASDHLRNPDRSFGVTTTLVEYRNGKQTDSSTLEVHSRADKNGGQYRNLIRFVAPARDANKLMLKNGNELWFYDAANKASIRISPQQRLLGQAANGDVVTVNLARDYQAELDGREEIKDGDGQACSAWKLKLSASSADVTYRRLEMWVDAASSQPLKARYFSESGRLLKTAYFRRVRHELGADRPTEAVIIDGLDPGWVTVLRYSDWVWREVPEAWLQRDYLPHFRAE